MKLTVVGLGYIGFTNINYVCKAWRRCAWC